MKKLLIAALILALILPAAALADLPDISGLTRDELIELDRSIQALLFSEELANGIKVDQGKYIIGEDIPAGTYRIEITGIGGYYDLYDKQGGKKISSGLTGSTYNVTDIGKLVLEEGNYLVFVNSSFIFFPYTGVFH